MCAHGRHIINPCVWSPYFLPCPFLLLKRVTGSGATLWLSTDSGFSAPQASHPPGGPCLLYLPLLWLCGCLAGGSGLVPLQGQLLCSWLREPGGCGRDDRPVSLRSQGQGQGSGNPREPLLRWKGPTCPGSEPFLVQRRGGRGLTSMGGEKRKWVSGRDCHPLQRPGEPGHLFG